MLLTLLLVNFDTPPLLITFVAGVCCGGVELTGSIFKELQKESFLKMKQYYKLIDSFMAPRKGETKRDIEVYIRP